LKLVGAYHDYSAGLVIGGKVKELVNILDKKKYPYIILIFGQQI
jgi:hypothetical protein